jgi:hypothetical protein
MAERDSRRATMTDAPKEKSKYSAHFERYILLIDRQRKASFTEKQAAIDAGQKVATEYPVVRVVVVDRDTYEETPITALSSEAS